MTSPRNLQTTPGQSDHSLPLGCDAPEQLVVTISLSEPDEGQRGRILRSFQPPHIPQSFPSLLTLKERLSSILRPVVVLPYPGLNKEETLAFVRQHARQIPILLYGDTSGLPIGEYCQPLAAGARQFLNTAGDDFLERLRETVDRLVEDLRAQEGEEDYLASLLATYGLLGRSVAMTDVFRRITKASHFSDLPVLLLGETGTGKQRVAEAIHALDPRRQTKPFVTINCGALSKSLAESELFGHARGAFSGAQGERKGLFRAANGGTLMLDEIGELDLELQPKLLRVLQEQRLLPVGEDYEHAVNVRIIAATHRNLERMVADGKFREDLFQRLNVFRITLPPLRDRPEDIELQAHHFLRQHSAGRPVPVGGFGPRAMEALCSLPWEGNTRQLQNLIREAIAHKETEGPLQVLDLPEWVIQRVSLAQPITTDVAKSDVDALVERACERKLTFGEAVEDYERRLLQRVLELTGGNRTRAAERLGLTPRTIFTKIKKYQLE